MVTLVVGGQYGGEGKGKIAAFLAQQGRFDVACRTGGPNSKHTVVQNGKKYDLRMIPTAAVTNFQGKIVYGAGSLIHIPTFFEELALTNILPERILIDRQAGVVTDACISEQRADDRYATIGSTLTGTGYATAQRALRKLALAREYPELKSFMGDASLYLSEMLRAEKNILIEGNQSAGLSNYHGDYPYTSNRDSTAAALLSELGIGPRYPLRIVLVIKVFPTRNHNGFLPNEVSITEADALGIKEYGGGSWGIENKRRRVGRIHLEQIKRAVLLNTPTEIALTGVDYLESEMKGMMVCNDLPTTVSHLIHEIEDAAGIPVTLLSTGPGTREMIQRASMERLDIQ